MKTTDKVTALCLGEDTGHWNTGVWWPDGRRVSVQARDGLRDGAGWGCHHARERVWVVAVKRQCQGESRGKPLMDIKEAAVPRWWRWVACGFLKIMSRTLFSPAAQGSDCRGASALQLCALQFSKHCKSGGKLAKSGWRGQNFLHLKSADWLEGSRNAGGVKENVSSWPSWRLFVFTALLATPRVATSSTGEGLQNCEYIANLGRHLKWICISQLLVSEAEAECWLAAHMCGVVPSVGCTVTLAAQLN